MAKVKLSAKVARIAQSHPEVKVALEAFDAAVKVATEAKSKLWDAVRQTPEFKMLDSLVGGASFAVDHYGTAEVVGQVNDYSNDVRTLDPKTLNALLTGKLLTDDEKRILLEQHGVRFTKPAPTPDGETASVLRAGGFDDEIPF